MSILKKDRSMCNGCYNEDYWNGLGGSKECWSFEKAEVEKKLEISVDLPPPYDVGQARPMLSCFNKRRYCMVKPESLNSKGFWK